MCYVTEREVAKYDFLKRKERRLESDDKSDTPKQITSRKRRFYENRRANKT
jgi:hypothetical protein